MPKKQVWQIFHEEHEIIETLKATFEYLKQKHGLDEKEVLELAFGKDSHLKVPAKIFATELSPLEAVVRFLKDEHSLSFHEIGVLLNRDDRTIWTTYSNAAKKSKNVADANFAADPTSGLQKPKTSDSPYQIPLMILSERELSILELAVEFLHDASQLSMKEIALLLNKHPSTIHTVYGRARQKRAGAVQQ
jgi:hypothetical protein